MFFLEICIILLLRYFIATIPSSLFCQGVYSVTARIPSSHIDLLQRPLYGVFTTISPQGYPENTIIWFSWDGEHILINATNGRRKVDNVRSNPHVALMVLDPDNPFRWIDVRGEVIAIEEDEEYQNINAHAKRYLGHDEYYGNAAPAELKGQEQRLIMKISPRRVVVFPKS